MAASAAALAVPSPDETANRLPSYMTCVGALPPHERAIFDQYFHEILPPFPASNGMLDLCARWALLRYRIDLCQRQEFACLDQMVVLHCEKEGIEPPADPQELLALQARLLLQDLRTHNVIARLRSFELRLQRLVDAVLDEYVPRYEEEAAKYGAGGADHEVEENYVEKPLSLHAPSALPTPPLSAPVAESTPRSAPCPCGSGLKYKRCCGRGSTPVLHL